MRFRRRKDRGDEWFCRELVALAVRLTQEFPEEADAIRRTTENWLLFGTVNPNRHKLGRERLDAIERQLRDDIDHWAPLKRSA